MRRSRGIGRLFVGGEWVLSTGNGRIAVVSPDTEAEVASGQARGPEPTLDRD